MRELRTVGISDLFVQWTVLGRKAFFPAAGFETAGNALLPRVLRFASAAAIRVWLGLALDPNYWEKIKTSAELLQLYFRERVWQLKQFLPGLERAAATARFAGWYVTDEIDDRTWIGAEKRTVLINYLKETTTLLRVHRPGAQVAISGFTNGFADPDLLASFWAELIGSAGMNRLLFQDGVGERKIALGDIGLYYGALEPAVQRAGGELEAVIELFSVLPDGKRVPAKIGRILKQVALAERFTPFPPVAFSVPDYMSNLAGPNAERLLANFIAAQRRCGR